jgi:hypothetical protein
MAFNGINLFILRESEQGQVKCKRGFETQINKNC